MGDERGEGMVEGRVRRDRDSKGEREKRNIGDEM